jgi:ADP-L-glycero-D-manno-heptose 6-epimerase
MRQIYTVTNLTLFIETILMPIRMAEYSWNPAQPSYFLSCRDLASNWGILKTYGHGFSLFMRCDTMAPLSHLGCDIAMACRSPPRDSRNVAKCRPAALTFAKASLKLPLMRMLVTGAAGFIGSNVAKRLVKEGHAVTALESFHHSSSWGNLASFAGKTVTLNILTDPAGVAGLEPAEVVFHQASITGVIDENGKTVNDDKRILETNVETFRRLLDWAVKTRARVVWASSCSVYGRGASPMRESQRPDPLNAYARSKLQMEELAREYAGKLAHPIVGLRYSNVYGPGERHKGKLASMIYQLAGQMRAGKRPRIFKAGEQKRDFVYIDDVVDANLLAMNAKESGVYNAGAGRSWSFNELVAELNRALGTKLEPEYFENPYGFTQDWTETDLTLATSKLGYRPKFDLRKGIEAYRDSGQLG